MSTTPRPHEDAASITIREDMQIKVKAASVGGFVWGVTATAVGSVLAM